MENFYIIIIVMSCAVLSVLLQQIGTFSLNSTVLLFSKIFAVPVWLFIILVTISWLVILLYEHFHKNNNQ